MPARVASPRFIGRETELERLFALFKRAASEERAATVLIGGEAGVGKTRLVSELITRARGESGLCISGSCLELVDRALPFGPVVQAIRALHRALDPPTLEAVIGPAHEALSRLVPELHGSGEGDATQTVALFEQLLGVLERLGDRMPTLLILEDLHWADHSTTDLLVFLARNLRDARVVVLGTYRSDDLHRRHPLRAILAELERSGSAERIELERFDRDEVRELLTAIVGDEPAPQLLDRIYRRSDGNAFFAEELLAASDFCGDVLPGTLRDIVLTRVDTLPASAQQALRVVAIIGRRADHRLVAALASASGSELTELQLLEGLRAAVAHQVLVTDADGVTYRFRHALVHEVIYDDLLPGERVELHARLAELLSEHPEWFDGGDAALAGELACHWFAAHDNRRALPAAIAAARAAERMYAYPEALAHVERALELWSQVDDAESLTGMRFVDGLRNAATNAHLAGATDRALDFIRAAAAEVDPVVDPVTAGMVHDRWAGYLWTLNGPQSEVLAHCMEAVKLVPPEPSTERARVVATLGQMLMLYGRNAESIEICHQAIALAEEVAARVTEGHARNTLGSALAALGQTDEGLAELHLAREIALETKSWVDAVRAAINESGALSAVGRHEEALSIAMEGAEIARPHGLDRSHGSFARLNACNALWILGRWDELDEQLREVESIDPIGVDAWRTSESRSLLYAAQGDFDAAQRERERMDSIMGADPDPAQAMNAADVEVHGLLMSGDLELAMARASDVAPLEMEVAALCADTGISLVLNGAAAAADLAARGRERHDQEIEGRARTAADAFAEVLEGWIANRRWGGGLPGEVDALVAQVRAELERANGVANPDAWSQLAEAWDGFAERPRVAYARWREGEARIAVGDRSGATTALRAAHAIASELRWAWVHNGVEEIGRRARLDLGAVSSLAPSAAERLGLTAREQEVLRLVAEGRTNRQIAEALFISSKTASVHVSNILAKLSVANRAEAGAAARRLGLDRVAV